MSCTHNIYFYHNCGHIINTYTNHAPTCTALDRGVAYLLSAVLSPLTATPCTNTTKLIHYVETQSCATCESSSSLLTLPSALTLHQLRASYRQLFTEQESLISRLSRRQVTALEQLNVLEPDHDLVSTDLSALSPADAKWVVEFLELRAEIADAIESGAPRDEGALASQQAHLLLTFHTLRTLISSHILASLPLAHLNLVTTIENRRALVPGLRDGLASRGFWLEESEWEEGEVCAICHDDEDVDSYVAVLPCGHKFHLDCIAEWFDRAEEEKCPFCRKLAHEIEVGNVVGE